MADPTEATISAAEVATLLGVSRNWVYEAAAVGILPAHRLPSTTHPDRPYRWRFRRSEILDWLEQQRTDGRA
jgi:excisionase family DNA binding protein